MSRREKTHQAVERLVSFLKRLPYVSSLFDDDYLRCAAEAIWDECRLQVEPHGPPEPGQLTEDVGQLIEAIRGHAPETRAVMESLGAIADPDLGHLSPSVGVRDTRMRSHHPSVRRALERIQEGYAEPLSVDELARAAYMSKSRFIAVFKRETGVTPHEHLRKIRIEAAMKQIRSGKDVTEACFAVGYTSLSGFGEAFANLTGMKPGEYRAAVQKQA